MAPVIKPAPLVITLAATASPLPGTQRTVPSKVTTQAATPGMVQAEAFIPAGTDAILWEDVNTQAATDNTLAETVTALPGKHFQASSSESLKLNRIESQTDI